MSAIEVRDLTVAYGRLLAIEHVDMDVDFGVVTGLIGPNGAGKTTLLRAMLGLLSPTSGTVGVGSRVPEAHRGGIAYLPQRSKIDADYPIQVRELVAMGRLPRTGVLGRRGPEERRVVQGAIARVGLEGLERRVLGSLSGGQQQRAHVARALAQEATIFVLDEPFAGVDDATVRTLVRVFRDLAADGAAVLVVVHDLALVEALCDRVVALRRTVVQQGPTAEVLADPWFDREALDPWPLEEGSAG